MGYFFPKNPRTESSWYYAEYIDIKDVMQFLSNFKKMWVRGMASNWANNLRLPAIMRKVLILNILFLFFFIKLNVKKKMCPTVRTSHRTPKPFLIKTISALQLKYR